MRWKQLGNFLHLCVLGWLFFCWWRTNWRNFGYNQETPGFSKVRFSKHFCPVWAARSGSRWWRVYLFIFSCSSVFFFLAVTTSNSGTCLSCCHRCSHSRAAMEGHRLRYQQEKSFFFFFSCCNCPFASYCGHINCFLLFSIFCLELLLEVLQCLSYSILWSLSTSCESLCPSVSYLFLEYWDVCMCLNKL